MKLPGSGTSGPGAGVVRSAADRGTGVVRDTAEFVAGAIDRATGGPAPDPVEQTLANTQMPEHLLECLGPHLKKLGFLLDTQPRLVRDGHRKAVYHHRVRIEGGFIALLHIGGKLLKNGAYAHHVLWKLWPFPSNHAMAVVIFADDETEKVEPVYSEIATNLVAMPPLKTVRFVSGQDMSDFDGEDLVGKRDKLKDWMGLDTFVPASRFASALKWTDLAKNTEEANNALREIREILIAQADQAPSQLGAKGHMRFLINETNWPDDWKTTRVGALTGIPRTDAQELVNWAVKQGENPEVEGYTVIGGLLEAMIGEKLGVEFLKDIIAKYNLMPVSSFLKME